MTNYSFADDFTGVAGSPPDPAKWVFDIGPGAEIGGNGELEQYTDSHVNCYQDGAGHLVIAATEGPAGTYNSARIKTLGKFSQCYGTWEAKIKITPAPGTWPAWWLMGRNFSYPHCGEIDILENYDGGSYVETTVWSPLKGIMKYNKYADVIVDTDWHVYRMVWHKQGHIQFLKDGAVYLTVNPSDLPGWLYGNGNPMYMVLNLAVGGSGGGDPSRTIFPVTMMVDYVHVW